MTSVFLELHKLYIPVLFPKIYSRFDCLFCETPFSFGQTSLRLEGIFFFLQVKKNRNGSFQPNHDANLKQLVVDFFQV